MLSQAHQLVAFFIFQNVIILFRLLPSKYKLTELPSIPDSLELFVILVVYFGITDNTGKITGKKRNLMRT